MGGSPTSQPELVEQDRRKEAEDYGECPQPRDAGPGEGKLPPRVQEKKVKRRVDIVLENRRDLRYRAAHHILSEYLVAPRIQEVKMRKKEKGLGEQGEGQKKLEAKAVRSAVHVEV